MKLRYLLAAAALAAGCNEGRTGAFGNLEFTPTDCGVIGCDFDDGVGEYGRVAVQISGLDGQPTAGLDLASRDPDLLQVTSRADISGAPAWELTALAPGNAELAAVDADGDEVDFIGIHIEAVDHLTMVPFTGEIVGPTVEQGFDEAFTVNADEQVGWMVRPVTAEGATPIGRYQFETVAEPDPNDITDHDLSNSDRPAGYLSVMLPAGDWPVEFFLTENQDVFVSAIIHAVPVTP